MALGGRESRVIVAPSAVAPVRGRLQGVLRELRKNPTMTLGLIIFLIVTLIAIGAPLIATGDVKKTAVFDRLEGPSSDHWFGTDHLGRDVFSRTIFGSRISLIVAVTVGARASVAGMIIGLAAGYDRRLDAILMRIMDGMMALPSLLLALAVIALLGASLVNVIAVICIVHTPNMVRLVRSSVLSLREQNFVEAARAIGSPPWRILAFHIAPNTIAPVIVQASFIFALSVMTEANLSFLGAGVPPETPTWGNIMGQGRTYLQFAVWITFFPGLFLSTTVLAINLIGDGLRDIMDPKLRRRM